ncbi:pentapeptide repeat-containing protein [Sphaerospermopsis sp. FACHB-1194]|uniref:pentapeptide repeat-containing protein n=1 Tax=Sphaerospermopsis sp. FACHB-1194 TaxID=2692862 RepID=UPI0016800A7D|nr:pentapeptide repeat-containing protein [Sphaerospermopsis sp. FACHB-1194]MBD2146054.1 pentapeptide repeat-containing protein [Sphaerospermopsis sp. FACHB-1194]
MNSEEFLQKYAEGQRGFFNVNLKNVNLEGVNLHHIYLSNVNLEGANLNGANFSCSTWNNVNLNLATLDNSILINASFDKSELNKASFINANIENCKFEDTSMLGTNFSKAILINASFRYCNLGGTIFTKSNLSKADFSEIKIWEMEVYWDRINMKELDEYMLENKELLEELLGKPVLFDEANLENTIFKDKQIPAGSSFKKADLSSADCRRVNFSNCDFREANLIEVNFTGANLTKCDFRQSNLIYSDFTGANLMEANFSEMDIGYTVYVSDSDYHSETYFIRANLHAANFKGTDLNGSNFIGANLTKCDFSQSNLNGTDFRNSNISGALFTGVNFDDIYDFKNPNYSKFSDAYFYGDDLPIDISDKNIESILTNNIIKNICYPHKISFKIINGRKESRQELINALEQAKKRLIITCPWITKSAVDDKLLEKLKQLLERGCQLDIGFGRGDKRYIKDKIIEDIKAGWGKGSYYNAVPDLFDIQKQYPILFNFKILGTHEKYLICDNEFCMIGSHNFLTSGDTSEEKEQGLGFDCPKTIQILIEKFDNSQSLISIEEFMNLYRQHSKE